MAVWLQSRIQSKIQETKAARQQQLAASTTATQSGSTSTPTVKPTATTWAGSVAALTQPQVNLFNPIKTTTPQIPQLTPISLTKEPEKQAAMTELFSDKKVDSPSVTSALAKMYDVLPENVRKPVEDAIEDNAKKILYRIWVNKLRSTKAWEAINMFSNKLMIWWAKETIEIWQWYLQKMYNADLLPWKTNMAMNMLMPWYPLYSDYLNKKLESTKIWQQIKETRNNALEAAFDWMKKGEKKLSNLEWYKYATKKQEEWSDKWKWIMDAIDEWRRDIVATNVWETAWQMLPSLIMWFITKNPKIAAWWIFTTVFWSSYKRSLLEINNNPEFDHLTAAQKDNLATAMAVVEAWIETLWDVIELAPFLKGKNLSIGNMLWIKNALLRAVVERQWASVIEWWEEVLTEILQNAFKRAYGWSDRATAQELWNIFSDTYFIMQFLWAVWWVKWGIETHRRNTAEKLLAHEAENFDNFEEFLEDAHRWWVEDDELIADAWATSKWLTNEDRAVIKRDVADVKKQEDKARTLYEEKQNVETELTQLRLSPTENETQIKNLETRLQEIDNNIQEIDNKIQEYQSVYNQQLPVQPQQSIQKEWGENLSEQTMGISEERVSLTNTQKNKFQSEYWSWWQQTPDTVSKFINKISKLSDNKAIAELSQYKNLSSISSTIDALISNGSSIASKPVLENVKRKIEGTQKYVDQEWDIVKGEKQQTFVWSDYKDIDSYTLAKLETADHLVWLKDSQLKWIKDKLTPQQKKQIENAFAIASTVLWIDYNIVTYGKYFWLTAWNKIPRNTALWRAIYNSDITKLWVILTLRHWEKQAASTLGHELAHILDYVWSKDNWYNWFRSVMSKYYDLFHSYKATEEWKDTKYLSTPTEIFARFTQQYIAFITDPNWIFKDMIEDKYMSKYTDSIDDWRFWSKEKFDELIPIYQSILDNEMSKYIMSPNNKKYAELMTKLDDYMAKKQFISDEKWLRDIEKLNPQIMEQRKKDEIKNEILDMEKRYIELKAIADWLEWDIRTEIWNEYQVALSMLDSNLDMLRNLGDAYIDVTTNTKEQQKELDDATNTIADNWPELISEVEDNQQEWEIIDEVMKPEIEWTEKPKKEPLDVAVAKVVKKVEKTVDQQVKDKNKREEIKDAWRSIKDVFTPALSRLYGISPRLAWAVHTYQATVWLRTLWYKKLTENFVKELDKLKKKSPETYKKLSLALFDWWMDDSIDIKQALKEAWLDEKLFEPVVSILNDIAKEYQKAWLDITINDKYFPRKVKDYGLLLDYLSRKSGKNIADTRTTLLERITAINENPKLSEWEKEVQVHNLLINEFTKPSERSNNAKERKLVLSEWLLTEEEKKQGYINDITDFYVDPIVALSNYIDDMVKKTELKKMLWWLTNDKAAISEKFDDSIAKILLDMQVRWELTEDKAAEAKKCINAIINAKATWKRAQRIKNLTYSMTIANRLSAAQQLEDLSKVLLRWPTWFKNIIKSTLGKANIKMSDTWLDNIFAELEWGKSITDLLFKLSWFDAVDALGKSSFINTARDSCVRQANHKKRYIILKTRLVQMYWEEMWNSIFESYKNNELREKVKDENWKEVLDENWKPKVWSIKLDVMVDLMYQLGNTQPIYKSAMPTAYLNNPKIRVVYCLWSFTIKQVDWVIQWTKEVYNNQLLLWRSKAVASTVAALRCTQALLVVSTISALVQEFINWAKWDDDELMFKKWKEEWFVEFLKQFWLNSLAWLLKIFNISKYDQYLFNREWLDWVIINKITPAPLNIMWDIVQVLIWKDKLAEMWKYSALFLKPLYYQFKNHDMLPDYKLWWGGEEETWVPTWSRSWWWKPSWSRSWSWKPSWSRSWNEKPTWSRSW